MVASSRLLLWWWLIVRIQANHRHNIIMNIPPVDDKTNSDHVGYNTSRGNISTTIEQNTTSSTTADETSSTKSDIVTLLNDNTSHSGQWTTIEQQITIMEQKTVTMTPIDEINMQPFLSSLNKTQNWIRSLYFYITKEVEKQKNRRNKEFTSENASKNDVTRVVDEDLIAIIAIIVLGLGFMLIVLSYIIYIFTHDHFKLRNTLPVV